MLGNNASMVMKTMYYTDVYNTFLHIKVSTAGELRWWLSSYGWFSDYTITFELPRD